MLTRKEHVMRMRVIFTAALMSCIVATSSTHAAAGVQCGERKTIVAQLTKKFKERQAAIGLANNGRLLEIWASNKSNSFTILMTFPTMRSCIVTAGREFALLEIDTFNERLGF